MLTSAVIHEFWSFELWQIIVFSTKRLLLHVQLTLVTVEIKNYRKTRKKIRKDKEKEKENEKQKQFE